ncbi:MAG: ABC transporter ATP-binding protein [Victivallales bacterium]|nr:ABC transporter ATP-binding protein [Victivallales bacterium]
MSLFSKPREHTRDYLFRPPAHITPFGGTDWPLYLRFIRKYVWPRRWILLLCILFVSANSTSVYILTYLTKTIVDEVLVIKAPPRQQPGSRMEQRVWKPDRERFRSSRPVVSMGRQMDNGVRLGTQRPPDAGRRLLRITLTLLALRIGLNLLARLSCRMQIIVQQNITGRMREDMHQKILELSMSYHQSMSPGRLLSRIMSDVQSVRVEMMALFMSATHCISMMLVGSAILLSQNWRIALLAFCIAPMYALMYHRKRPEVRRLNMEIRHTNSCLYGLVSQKIDGVKAIQAYARELGEVLTFHRVIACSIRDTLAVQYINSGLSRNATILTSLSSTAIFLYGGWLSLQGEMTLGEMMFLHNTAMTLFQPALEFTNLSFVLQRLRIALLRVVGVIDRKVEIYDKPGAVDFPRPLRKGIELRNIYFSYPQSITDKEAEESSPATLSPSAIEPVLKGVNLNVPAGTWLCIMGASGSGKTTLLNLLSRLYLPTHGKILVDDIPLDNIRLASLRQGMGIVPQEAQIFSGSMRDNICYGRPNATNTQIMDAAKAAEMHDFILGMKVQYETLIGQKGASLSGGQRQRLSLARALLTDPEVLILDDCTSALDANTERKIQETLAQILVGKTAIMVSQRVSMAMRCHKIAVLEKGVVSEYGTHAELLARNGFYARLFHQQTE